MSVEDLMEDLFQVKRILREMKYREEFLKERLNLEMDLRQTNMIRTDYFQVKRRTQTREFIHKNDVPEEVWQQLATPTTFWVMNVKPT